MTNTNQAFIEAYERTASQQAMQSSTLNDSLDVSHRTPTGPHFRVEEKTQSRGPLSRFISKNIANVNSTDGSNPEATRQSIRSTKVLDTDSVPLYSTFEVTEFRWPAAAISLVESASDSMISVIDQVIASSTNVLAFSSARQQVGLTTTTLAFALAAREAGMKVAMIDLCYEDQSDMSYGPSQPLNKARSSSQSVESLTQSLGLSKLRSLREASMLGMSLGEAIITSQSERASLLAAGHNLEPQIASAAIQRIAAANDFVLIDAGIVGAPERSLSEWIEPVQGASLLVDLAEGSRYDAARLAAANQLSKVSSQFLGVIENLV